MKKGGKYYYDKDGRIITIYLIDPVLYNEQKDKKFISEIGQDCLIEKGKKGVKGFCIPTIYLDDLGMIINHDDFSNIKIDGNSYYKIDMGGKGDYQTYVFTCSLITNSEKQLEIIQIEI